jgi:hypothetical protein
VGETPTAPNFINKPPKYLQDMYKQNRKKKKRKLRKSVNP